LRATSRAARIGHADERSGDSSARHSISPRRGIRPTRYPGGGVIHTGIDAALSCARRSGPHAFFLRRHFRDQRPASRSIRQPGPGEQLTRTNHRGGEVLSAKLSRRLLAGARVAESSNRRREADSRERAGEGGWRARLSAVARSIRSPADAHEDYPTPADVNAARREPTGQALVVYASAHRQVTDDARAADEEEVLRFLRGGQAVECGGRRRKDSRQHARCAGRGRKTCRRFCRCSGEPKESKTPGPRRAGRCSEKSGRGSVDAVGRGRAHLGCLIGEHDSTWRRNR